MKDTLIGSVIFVSFACWLAAICRMRGGRPLVAYQPRGRVPWGAADLLFALLALLVFQALAMNIASRLALPEPGSQLARVLAGASGGLAAVAASVTAISLRTGASWTDFGLDRRYIFSDVRLGGVAFLMLAPPVYGLQHLLVQWFPSQHPLLSLLTEHGSPAVYLVVGLSAAIIAPLTEEYLFRLLLQGWTEGALAARGETTDSSQGISTWRHSDELQCAPETQALPIQEVRAGWLAILVSATLFAALHASHGPDPIPLFVLAIGLGYLYQRTRRILPSITVHFLLNSATLATFLLQ
jgi:membrane protease YdiL (CAAX protease family)